jgi:hypothetical protein
MALANLPSNLKRSATFHRWSWLVFGSIAVSAWGCKPEEVRQQEIAAEQAAAKAAAAQPAMQNQVAGVGVGVQGRSLEGGSDYNPAKFVSGPAAAYFRTKEKIVFDIQIPHTLNAFQALHGRFPKSHEEYMREIVGTQIKLPKLPAGMAYRYHPETNELWVEAESAASNQDSGLGANQLGAPPQSGSGE